MSVLLPTGNQINLQLGWPSPSLFPRQALNAGADDILTDFNSARDSLIYGPNCGSGPLRKEVARWLGSVYHGNPQAVDERRICIAGGASQNLSNILLRFTDPHFTRRIWMVEPTYFLACPVFEDCGYIGKLRGVPEDDEGIDLDFLRAALEEAEAEAAVAAKAGGASAPTKTAATGYEKIYKHVIYVVPTFSNPSGKTMSLQHRHDLVRLAIEYDALIVSDDVYDFLYWPADKGQTLDRAGKKTRPPPRLVDVNRQLDPDSKWGNTVSNGSFSKLIAPGTRVSWSESTPAFASFLGNTGATWSGGNPAHLTSTIVGRMLASGALEKHIQETLIPTYEARYHVMVAAIKEHLEPLGVRITMGKPYSENVVEKGNVNGNVNGSGSDNEGTNVQIAGGFFLSVSLPKDAPAAPLLAKTALENHELKFAYGKMFEIKGDSGSKKRSEESFGNIIRLCWAFHEEDDIVKGIERMRDALLGSK